MSRTLVALFVSLSAAAGAAPLASSVERLAPEPAVVIVAKAAGKTPLERYRAGATAGVGALPANTPLVAEIRLTQANGPDVVTVTDAHRDGHRIAIAIDNRRFLGALDKNVVWEPLVEVELGALASGSYAMTIDERVLQFDADPKKAQVTGRGLSYTATLAIP